MGYGRGIYKSPGDSPSVKQLRVTASVDPDRAPAFFDLLANSPGITETRLLDWNTAADRDTVLYAIRGDATPFTEAAPEAPAVASVETATAGPEWTHALVEVRTAEGATPADPGEAEYPGNSGVFLADRYELQILDCATAPIYADGWTGAIYGQHPPQVDACLPPGEWQSFDIVWRRPRFDGDTLTEPARITALHNGVVIHDCTVPFGPTTYRDFHEYDPHGPAPLRLQDHGFRVRFRNVWYRPL